MSLTIKIRVLIIKDKKKHKLRNKSRKSLLHNRIKVFKLINLKLHNNKICKLWHKYKHEILSLDRIYEFHKFKNLKCTCNLANLILVMLVNF